MNTNPRSELQLSVRQPVGWMNVLHVNSVKQPVNQSVARLLSPPSLSLSLVKAGLSGALRYLCSAAQEKRG